MKKFIYILAAAAAVVLSAATADAQMGKREYINAGWQFNGTVGNSFVKTAQGYGAYIEGGYYITPMFAVGGFASFNTNNDYIPKETYTFDDQSALTTVMLYNNHQISVHATVSIYLTHVFGDRLILVGVVWFCSMCPSSSFQEQQASQGMSI